MTRMTSPIATGWGSVEGRAQATGAGPLERSNDGEDYSLSQTAMSPADGMRPALTTLPSMTSPGVLRMP